MLSVLQNIDKITAHSTFRFKCLYHPYPYTCLYRNVNKREMGCRRHTWFVYIQFFITISSPFTPWSKQLYYFSMAILLLIYNRGCIDKLVIINLVLPSMIEGFYSLLTGTIVV